MLPSGSCMAGLVVKRKRGVDFVYLTEGCSRTHVRINEAIPQIWDMGAPNAPCHDLNKNECCSSSSYMLKTATFSVKDSAKTLSICPPQSLRTSAVTKLEIIFARTTLDGVSPYKFRWNRPRESLRSEAIIKKSRNPSKRFRLGVRDGGLLERHPVFLANP